MLFYYLFILAQIRWYKTQINSASVEELWLLVKHYMRLGTSEIENGEKIKLQNVDSIVSVQILIPVLKAQYR